MSATAPAPASVPPIREFRKRQGLGLRELARKADVDPSHLLKYEKGKGGLSPRQVAKVLEALGQYDVAELIRRYYPQPE